jgi:hypothetical protein
MQLAIFDRYNGSLLYDVTFEAKDTEFSTTRYGFGYCKFELNWPIEKAAQLFKLKSVGYVRLGTGNKAYFEGRLEDVELGNQITLTAFGYYRAFTDLQINDLWSTTDLNFWQDFPSTPLRPTGRNEMYTIQRQDGIKISLNKNVTVSGGPGNFGSVIGFYPSKSTRLLDTIDFYYQYVSPAISANIGLQRETELYTAYASSPNTFVLGSSASATGRVIASNLAASGLLLFLDNSPIAGLLFVGETGSFYVSYSGIRVGTTPSISGGRLYADEILRYTISGVNNLNTYQLSSDFSSIQSPRYDLTNIWFKDQTGLQVVEELLKYPDTSGNEYELKIWENQKVLFRPKTNPNTWYIDISEISLNRTLDKYFNQVNARYTDTMKRETLLRLAVTGFHNRQTVLTLNTTDPNIVATAGAALLSDYQRKPPQSEISTTFVRDSNGSYQEAINVRSGDKIIIQNIPPTLFDAIDNTFIVEETIASLDSGLVRIIPEQPIAQLETLLSKVKF